jgi:hypothetical protein
VKKSEPEIIVTVWLITINKSQFKYLNFWASSINNEEDEKKKFWIKKINFNKYINN